MTRELAWSIAGTTLTIVGAFAWLMLRFELERSYPLLTAYALSVAPMLLLLGLALGYHAWSERRGRRRLTDAGSRPE